jgi:hypothetical protein
MATKDNVIVKQASVNYALETLSLFNWLKHITRCRGN